MKILVKLKMPKRQEPETPFLIDVAFTNKSDSDAWFLSYETPLEGLFSDCFDVLRDGVHVPYDGPLAKRRLPNKDDYVKVKAGESVSAEVDLSDCYQVSVPGEYEVVYQGKIGDVVPKAKWRAKKTEVADFSPIAVKSMKRKFTVGTGQHGRATLGEVARRQEGEPDRAVNLKNKKRPETSARTPKLIGGNEAQNKATTKAHKDGFKITKVALKGLKKDAQYKEWFGKFTTARCRKVREVLAKTLTAMANTRFTYDLSGTGCHSSWFAYTYKSTTTIWMCGAFWKAEATGTDSKAGTVLHEHTHATAFIDDIMYGQSRCRLLAKETPESAIRNSDSYEYFAGG